MCGQTQKRKFELPKIVMNSKEKGRFSAEKRPFSGAAGRIRTADLILTKGDLYKDLMPKLLKITTKEAYRPAPMRCQLHAPQGMRATDSPGGNPWNGTHLIPRLAADHVARPGPSRGGPPCPRHTQQHALNNNENRLTNLPAGYLSLCFACPASVSIPTPNATEIR